MFNQEWLQLTSKFGVLCILLFFIIGVSILIFYVMALGGLYSFIYITTSEECEKVEQLKEFYVHQLSKFVFIIKLQHYLRFLHWFKLPSVFLPSFQRLFQRLLGKKMMCFFLNRTIAIKTHSFISYERITAPKYISL